MSIIIPTIFICLSVLALILHILGIANCWSRAHVDTLAKQLQFIDVAAFHNLIDASETQFLRDRLPEREFRRIHQERMLAAVEYVLADARNSWIMVRLAQAADEEDPVLAASVRSLVNALQIGIFASGVILRLYFSILFPRVSLCACLDAQRHTTAQQQLVARTTRRAQVRRESFREIMTQTAQRILGHS